MTKDINTLYKEKQKLKRKAIQYRIDELIDWLFVNSSSDAQWDINVRELNACEAQLAQMDHKIKKNNCIDYGMSIKAIVPSYL